RNEEGLSLSSLATHALQLSIWLAATIHLVSSAAAGVDSKTGHTFTEVIRYGKILDHPVSQPEHTTRPVSYEVGTVFQLDRDHCLLVASMREQGGHDFEVGNDAFVFQGINSVNPTNAITINRLDVDRPLKSGKGACVLGKFPATG